MKNHNQLPPKKISASLTVGLSAFLLLFLLNSCSRANTGIQAATPTSPDAAESHEPSQEIPEQEPDPEAHHTPTPGFLDTFDDHLSTVWTVHYGDPFVADGQLSSKVGAGIAAGDPTWIDYQIDFDVDTSQITCTFVDTSNSLGVRVRDFDHAYWFVFTSCEAGWSSFAGGVHEGSLSFFPNTKVKISSDAKHITIKVEGTKLAAYENGSLLSAIDDPILDTGGIFLQIEAQTLYDNFKVTLLP